MVLKVEVHVESGKVAIIFLKFIWNGNFIMYIQVYWTVRYSALFLFIYW